MNKAYVIHTRDFRETSLLIDFFTEHHGFIKAVARGVRGNKKNNKRGLLQLFTPLLIDWRGNSDLVTLTSVELAAQPYRLRGHSLIIGFYLNELIYYLFNKYTGENIEGLFSNYQSLLDCINTSTDNIESKLRDFELDLLDTIGYGLQCETIDSNAYYAYSFEDGFHMVNTDYKKSFKGSVILDINKRNWHNQETLIVAKILLRQILQYHIGNKDLQSRKLFNID